MREVLRKLLDEKMKLQVALLSGMGQAVIATDSNGMIGVWSGAAEELYGWREEEVIGRNIVEVTPADISKRQASSIMKALSAGEIWSGDFAVMDRHGRGFLASVADIPLIDQSGAVAGIVGVSAPRVVPTSVRAVLSAIHSAARALWPSSIELTVEGIGEDEMTNASEPHLQQLFAILLLQEFEALRAGEPVEIAAVPAGESVFEDFEIERKRPSVHVRLSRTGGKAADGHVLRELRRSATESGFAPLLVASAGGRLFEGSVGGRRAANHLILPLTKRKARNV